MPRTIGMLLFNDVEELDVVGPWEVLGCAQRLGAAHTLLTLGPTAEPVRARYGLRITPDVDLASAPALDVLLVPGGLGARTFAREHPPILELVRRTHAQGWVVSVCTGALVLAAAGVLDGHRATTHASAFELLRETPGIEVVAGARWIIEEPVASSAGVSAGVDLALALVEHWYGAELRAAVQQRVEWPHWTAEHAQR